MRRTLWIAAGVTLGLAALAAPILLPRSEDPPALLTSEAYLTHVERAVFNGSVAEVQAALASEAGSVLAFVKPTDRIPEISALIPIDGTFPDPGARRYVELATGDRVTERVLQYDETRFAYQIWGFTAANARPIDHIQGAFTYEDLGDGRTEVTWTYAVAPRIFYARPFIASFLENDFGPFMAAGLSGAADAFNTSPAS